MFEIIYHNENRFHKFTYIEDVTDKENVDALYFNDHYRIHALIMWIENGGICSKYDHSSYFFNLINQFVNLKRFYCNNNGMILLPNTIIITLR